jgi:TonB family protein
MKVFTAVVFVVLLSVRIDAQQPPSEKPTTATAGSPQDSGTSGVPSNVEVLSDTQGVDFGPYLSKIVQAIRKNWYALIPPQARPPELKSGNVSIEFAILRDGHVAAMKLTHPSGDTGLDRAAWGGITASVPFAPLPEQFRGPYLALRFRFQYNPKKTAPNDPTKNEAH